MHTYNITVTNDNNNKTTVQTTNHVETKPNIWLKITYLSFGNMYKLICTFLYTRQQQWDNNEVLRDYIYFYNNYVHEAPEELHNFSGIRSVFIILVYSLFLLLIFNIISKVMMTSKICITQIFREQEIYEHAVTLYISNPPVNK